MATTLVSFGCEADTLGQRKSQLRNHLCQTGGSMCLCTFS